MVCQLIITLFGIPKIAAENFISNNLPGYLDPFSAFQWLDPLIFISLTVRVDTQGITIEMLKRVLWSVKATFSSTLAMKYSTKGITEIPLLKTAFPPNSCIPKKLPYSSD